MVRPLLAAAVLFLCVSAHAQQRPSFVLTPQNVVGVTLPVATLSDPTVKKQLASGLTTTFVVNARSREVRGAARLEVRYDLWDEQWIVRRIDFDGRTDSQRLPSRESLERWWRSPVRLFSAIDVRTTIDLQLAVLPFSANEEADARAWMSRSAGVGTTASGGGLVDALIGTTLNARPITTFRWRIELSPR